MPTAKVGGAIQGRGRGSAKWVVPSGWSKAREEGGVHQRNGGITTMLIPRSPGLPRGMGPPCPRRGSPSCEIRVVLTRVFSRPKISAWVPLGRRGEYGGVTYVSVSGCPFRWITPPILSLPSDARVPPLGGDASRHSGGMGGRHQIRRGVGRRRRVGRAGGY